MKLFKRVLSGVCCAALLLTAAAGCTKYEKGSEKVYSYDEAITELNAFNKEINTDTKKPKLDIYDDDTTNKVLADIKTFPVKVEGKGEINLEIAAPSELCGDTPDDWLNIVAERFNEKRETVGGKTVSITVRKIASGETLTYITEGDYRPQLYIPSSFAWGDMLKAKGVGVEKLSDRILGNTAGILMEKGTYDVFIKKYKSCTLDKVIEASLAGNLTFAYTNPYTSATGLNALASALYAFDNNDPLSDSAQKKLLEYQKQSPPVAYTTGVLVNQASKGIIKAMVMEEQAYINKPELKNYVYTPFGIRHDHPLYTFDYVTEEEKEAAKLFMDYCLTDSSQRLGKEKGFGKHDDYSSQKTGLDGAGYLAAQGIWKEAKDGGQPIIAVFVADVSGSMDGTPIQSLKESLLSTKSYIGSDNYIGLVSYATNVHIDLPIDRFDAQQKAYFSGAVKALTVEDATATYDAVLVAMKMMIDKKEEVPNAKLMLFVLSDGDQNRGYSLDRIAPIVGGLKIPVYTIGYNIKDDTKPSKELSRLSNINEAAMISADSEDLVNQLRNLFNTQL
ncbi:MAG: VWA domain-containing protein [Ruminococcus sp.]|nr:VWA domain-containing protein [Ruminococcus sp.]